MNELKVISKSTFLGKEVDVYGTVENPLFLAKDVAEWIEHSNITDLVSMVDDDEKLTSTISKSGQGRSMWFLTEGGLYEVLMLSRKPIAKRFKKGVKEILKSIRKTGSYSINQSPSLTEQVNVNLAFAEWNIKQFNLNEASKINWSRKIGEKFGLVTDALPQSVNAGTDHPTLHSATELLRMHGVDMSAQKFNNLLDSKGIVKTATRPGKGGKVHSWKVLQPEYDKYGQNVQDPKFQNQTQIKWYDKLFGELLDIVSISEQKHLDM